MSNPDAPWRDEATLREKYSELRSTYAVGEALGCSNNCIREWMEEFGIDRNPRPRLLTMRSDPDGYEYFQNTEGTYLYVHSLTAIAEGADPQKVFSPEFHVHHRNGVRWDNRPCNLELLDAKEHIRQHALENHKQRERDDAGRFV